MTPQSGTTLTLTTSVAADVDSDFDLDIETIPSAPVIPGLLNDTSDGCTSTCQSACANSTCIA